MSETPKSFKDNFTDFAKSLGSSLNIFKQNVQQAISGVNTIAQNNKKSLDLCWKISEDSWGGGQVLGANIGKTSTTIFLPQSSEEPVRNTNINLEDYTAGTTYRTWSFTNYLSNGTYLISMTVQSRITGSGTDHTRTIVTRARLYDGDGNLIAYSADQAGSGDSNTAGCSINGSGLFEVPEERDYEFSVTTDNWSSNISLNYYGVLLTFIRLF